MDHKTATRWMEEAFLLALGARGTTLPNPAVGCIVLDKSGKKIAQAATSPDGRPHAERKALEQAGAKARGGTLIVTLEPCVAFPGKKSPPCAAAVLLSGIESVVVGTTDPHPQVSGRGLHALRKAGMEVVECPLDGRIADFYAGFGHFLSHRIPRVTVKIAVSRDGNMAAAPGTRTPITGDESRRFTHRLRAQSDAILIGGATALADDPELTVRDAPGRTPHRLVLWPSGGLPPHLKIWSTAAPTSALGIGPRPSGLPEKVAWIALDGDANGKVDWMALLRWCGERGMHDLLIEPGPRLLDSILKKGLWDGLWVLRSNRDLPGGVPADPRQLLPQVAPVSVREFGGDTGSFWTGAGFRSIPPLS